MAGSVSTSSSPVTAAERSSTVWYRRVSLFQSASANPAAAMDTAASSRQRSPKKIVPARRVGSSAIKTSSMIRRVLSLQRICGDEDMLYCRSIPTSRQREKR